MTPVVIIVFAHIVRPSVPTFQNLAKQNKFHVIASGSGRMDHWWHTALKNIYPFYPSCRVSSDAWNASLRTKEKEMKEKTGVINDPLGQPHSPASSKHYFHLMICLFYQIFHICLPEVRNMCINIMITTGHNWESATWIKKEVKEKEEWIFKDININFCLCHFPTQSCKWKISCANGKIIQVRTKGRISEISHFLSCDCCQLATLNTMIAVEGCRKTISRLSLEAYKLIHSTRSPVVIMVVIIIFTHVLSLPTFKNKQTKENSSWHMVYYGIACADHWWPLFCKLLCLYDIEQTQKYLHCILTRIRKCSVASHVQRGLC